MDVEATQVIGHLGFRIDRVGISLRKELDDLQAEVRALREEIGIACGILRDSNFARRSAMVMTKPELIASLQHEVHILLHLAGKIDRTKLDYRPAPKQRSTIQLLQYLSMMGPELIREARVGKFDPPTWTAAERAAEKLDFDQAVAAIAAQKTAYASLLADISDADLRAEINMFGTPTSRGAFIVNLVLAGCAAYRTQLFLYLKACGREELSTINLWAGVDAPASV